MKNMNKIDENMNKPHKYAEVIKAWADGATVQYWDKLNKWVTQTTPSFDPWLEWRVKPDDPKPDVEEYAKVF
jgi:hypothetical protein